VICLNIFVIQLKQIHNEKIITTVALTVSLMFGANAQQGEALGGVN